MNFGLAPYFKDQLVTTIKSSDFFAVSYDESMNRVLQEEQMDIIVRFWDDDEGMVKTRYLDSKFLKRPNCQNLLEKLLDGISFLPLCRMLQLSMDGLNVNWSVFKMLDEHFSEHDFGTLINIGSCGLHIVHGAFQTGVQSTG